MKDHDEIHTLLSAYCGGELSPAEKARVEAHLELCPICRADLGDLETALRLIRSTPEVEPPPWLTSRIMTRLREEDAPRRRWYEWLFSPLRTKLPLEVMALLVVCVSGYYLARNLENQVNAPAVRQETPATPAPAAEPAKPATQEPAPAAPGHEAPLPEKLEHPAIRQQPPAAPKAAEQPAPPPAPAVSGKAAAPPPYAPSPPIRRGERAVPASGAIETMEAAPKTEQGIRSPVAAPEMKNGAHKEKKAARAPGRSLADEGSSPAAGAPAAEAPTGLRLRLAVGDLSSANQLVRQAVTRSGGEVSRVMGERLIKVRIGKERLPELLMRLGRLGRVLEKPALPDSDEMPEFEISW